MNLNQYKFNNIIKLFFHSGDALLVLWKSNSKDSLTNLVHVAISCALFIQQALGSYETDVDIELKGIKKISL